MLVCNICSKNDDEVKMVKKSMICKKCYDRVPLSLAKSEEELIKLNHYTNLQPLCSKINRDIKKDYM